MAYSANWRWCIGSARTTTAALRSASSTVATRAPSPSDSATSLARDPSASTTRTSSTASVDINCRAARLPTAPTPRTAARIRYRRSGPDSSRHPPFCGGGPPPPTATETGAPPPLPGGGADHPPPPAVLRRGAAGTPQPEGPGDQAGGSQREQCTSEGLHGGARKNRTFDLSIISAAL